MTVLHFFKTPLFSDFSLILPPFFCKIDDKIRVKNTPYFKVFKDKIFRHPFSMTLIIYYIKNKTYKYQHYFVSAVLPDDPVSLIGINYNTCILILNENATKINIPLKHCVQMFL